MSLAIIQSGGKQYVVTEGAKVKVDKMPAEEGSKVVFSEVLLTNNGSATAVGTPLVKGAKVEGKVLRQARYPKIFGAKVKGKKRYKKYFGHKQAYTEVEIAKITAK